MTAAAFIRLVTLELSRYFRGLARVFSGAALEAFAADDVVGIVAVDHEGL